MNQLLEKMSAKADADHYITDLDSMQENPELYIMPHIRSFYS